MAIRNFTKIGAVLIVSAVLAHCTIAAGGTIYVKEGGAGDGTSWANAYGDLQDGLDDAGSGDDVWVAAGTYYPTTEVGETGERYKTFQMKTDVAIYGGFPSGGNPNFNDRDPNA